MADNPLTKLPLPGQLGVSAAVAVLIAGLFWWFYWSPAEAEYTQKEEELKGLQKEITALQVTAAKLQDFEREVAQLEAKLETLKRILPPRKETPDLLRKVQNLATQSNLLIKRFNPGGTVAKEFYEEWPINIDVEGTYHNLGLFFDRVGRLPRLVNVGNLKIKAQAKQTPSNTIAASCIATTFVYLETPPTPGGPKR